MGETRFQLIISWATFVAVPCHSRSVSNYMNSTDLRAALCSSFSARQSAQADDLRHVHGLQKYRLKRIPDFPSGCNLTRTQWKWISLETKLAFVWRIWKYKLGGLTEFGVELVGAREGAWDELIASETFTRTLKEISCQVMRRKGCRPSNRNEESKSSKRFRSYCVRTPLN